VKRPYVVDSLTGQSRTREFVEAFLEAYISPTTDGPKTTRSVYDTLFSTVAPPQDVLYLNKPRNPVKTYIGRAAALASSQNPDEYLWCVVADVSKACSYLTPEQKQIVALRYIRDLGDHEIADLLGVPVTQVIETLSSSIKIITDRLDGRG